MPTLHRQVIPSMGRPQSHYWHHRYSAQSRQIPCYLAGRRTFQEWVLPWSMAASELICFHGYCCCCYSYIVHCGPPGWMIAMLQTLSTLAHSLSNIDEPLDCWASVVVVMLRKPWNHCVYHLRCHRSGQLSGVVRGPQDLGLYQFCSSCLNA